MIRRVMALPRRLRRIREDMGAGLPRALQPVLHFLATGIPGKSVYAVARENERLRAHLARRQGSGVEIWYSPEPGSWSDLSGIAPAPGKSLTLSWSRLANTGKNRSEGILLHLLARGFAVRRCLELGACAGLSARYLAMAPSVTEIVTVEGSPSLSTVAVETLASLSNARVMNATFSQAIDRLLETEQMGSFDFIFIDGHHESRATLHYFDRLRPLISPGSVVVFDDVSWSEDMRTAWEQVTHDVAFMHCLALGNIGVCIAKTHSDSPRAQPKVWDMEYLIPLAPVGSPWGWKRGSASC